MASITKKRKQEKGKRGFKYHSRKLNTELLKDLPEKLLDGYDILEKSGVQLPEDAFKAVIDTKKCIYVGVVPEHMSEFKLLACLDLSGHRMEISALSCFPSLQELYLSCNAIKEIRLSAMQKTVGFKSLTALDLSYNAIDPESFSELGKLSKLQFLDLSNNQMNELPKLSKDKFCELKKLVLHGNRFGRVKKRDSSQSESSYFDPESNFFKSHYEFFHILSKLPALRELDLSSNIIQVIPRLLPGSFPKLRQMNLSLNYLERESYLLPILSCPMLRWLDIRANLFVPVGASEDTRTSPLIRLTSLDFPGVCQRLRRNRRGNVVFKNPTNDPDEEFIIRSEDLHSRQPNDGKEEDYDFTQPLQQIEDPTEKLERELEDFGTEDLTFITTSFPKLQVNDKSQLNQLQDRKGKRDGRSQKQTAKALALAIRNPSTSATYDPREAEREGKHHLKTTFIQKTRQQPRRPKHDSGQKGLKTLTVQNRSALKTLDSVIAAVQKSQGLQTHRSGMITGGSTSRQHSSRQYSSRSSARQREDVLEICEIVNKMLTNPN